LVIYKDFSEIHGQQKVKINQQNQEPSQQSTTRRNTKTFKNVLYHLDTASTIYKKKTGMYKQKWMQENMRKLKHASGLPNLATLLADLLWLNSSLFRLKILRTNHRV